MFIEISYRPDLLEEYIARERKYRLAKKENVHYSWNWSDVHFVQLNLYPGNENSPDPDNPYLSPKNSLAFLIADLDEQVGDSDRPVILIHHYGFDNLSVGNNRSSDHPYIWGDTEIEAYWNAIADYNVIAIITGHKHTGFNTNGENNERWNPYFMRPDGLTNGRDSIPTFVAGGAVDGGFYIEVVIMSNSLLVTRHQAEMKGKKFQNSWNRIDSQGIVIE